MIYLVIIILCVVLSFVFITEKARIYLTEIIFATCWIWLIIQINLDVVSVGNLNVLKSTTILILLMSQIGFILNGTPIIKMMYDELKESNELRNIRKFRKQEEKRRLKSSDVIETFIDKCRGQK
jgi:hypothetical protein